jgi:hypothetical protein
VGSAAAAYLRPPDGKEPETRLRAREVFIRIVSNIYKRLYLVRQEPRFEEKSKALGNLLHLLDHVATRLPASHVLREHIKKNLQPQSFSYSLKRQ